MRRERTSCLFFVGSTEGEKFVAAAVGEDVDERVGILIVGGFVVRGSGDYVNGREKPTALSAVGSIEHVYWGAPDEKQSGGRVELLVAGDVFCDMKGPGGHPC